MKRGAKRAADAGLSKWVREHRQRRTPACPIWKQECACPLMPLPSDVQNQFKREEVLHAYSALPEVKIGELIAADQREHYRSKVVFSYDGHFGGYARGTHTLLDLDGCIIEDAILQRVAGWLRKNVNVKPFAEGTGDLRYVAMRSNGREALVAFIGPGASAPKWAQQVAGAIRTAIPEVKGVAWSENSGEGNAVWVAPHTTIAGENYIVEDVDGLSIRLNISSFFQVHRAQAARLRSAVLAALADSHSAWDLFCGVGVNALLLAKRGVSVSGVESHEAAIADARDNANRLGLSAQFFCASLDAKDESAARQTLAALPTPEAVIINPPRKGASTALISAVLERAPKTIVYVACAPEPLARAAAQMYENNYIAKSVTPYDLFPHTPHVETLAIFTKR